MGGYVQALEFVSRDLRQLLGQKALLQRVGDLRALAVEARVLDRHRRARGDLLGQLEIRLFERSA